MRNALSFIVDYVYYLCALNLRRWFGDWLKGFLDEILESRVNQVSLLVGTIGISGILLTTVSYMAENPFVPLVAVAVGLCVFVGLTMRGFAAARRIAATSPDFTDRMTSLLSFLVSRRPTPRSEILTHLRCTDKELAQLLDQMLHDGWLQAESGAFKIPETMKPLARKRIRQVADQKGG